MVPVCDKRYHIYNRFRHFWAEIKKLWNYPFMPVTVHGCDIPAGQHSIPVHDTGIHSKDFDVRYRGGHEKATSLNSLLES